MKNRIIIGLISILIGHVAQAYQIHGYNNSFLMKTPVADYIPELKQALVNQLSQERYSCSNIDINIDGESSSTSSSLKFVTLKLKADCLYIQGYVNISRPIKCLEWSWKCFAYATDRIRLVFLDSNDVRGEDEFTF